MLPFHMIFTQFINPFYAHVQVHGDQEALS
jgi:hypothetical protein